MVITYNRYRLVFSWLNEYKVTVKILKVAVNKSDSKVTVKNISTIEYHLWHCASLTGRESQYVTMPFLLVQYLSFCKTDGTVDTICGIVHQIFFRTGFTICDNAFGRSHKS